MSASDTPVSATKPERWSESSPLKQPPRKARPAKRAVTYMLRTCRAGMRAYGGFVWPRQGYVEAPDWSHLPVCGGGLHGLLMGAGSTGYFSDEPDAVWMVVEVYADEVVDIHYKVKVPRTTPAGVVFCGDRPGAVADILARGADPAKCNYAILTGGDGVALIGGNFSTVTGGHDAILIGGDNATLVGGDGATLTGGCLATLTGGNFATLTGGDGAILIGGGRSILTGGESAFLKGGDFSTLNGGPYATLTGGAGALLIGGNNAKMIGGRGATLIGGDHATLVGGKRATLVCRWRDHLAHCVRTVAGECGEGGLLADVAYQVWDGKFIAIPDVGGAT